MKKVFILVFVLCSLLTIHNCEAQWQTDVRLTNDSAASLTSQSSNGWGIATSGSIIHVVWYDFRNGDSEIYYKRSTNAGVNWGVDIRLTNNTANSYDPSVAVSGAVVHVAWRDIRDGNMEIYYKRSTDAGINWETDVRMTNNTANSISPSIAVSGSAVHLVWDDSRDAIGNNKCKIYYKRSTDAGESWGADTRLTNDTADSINPSIAVSGSFVHVVYSSSRIYNLGVHDIFYKRSTDGGISWGADTCLTPFDGFQRLNPSVAVSGSYVHIAWYDERGNNNDIYYKHSANGGISWGIDACLSNSLDISMNPNIAVSGSVVHVVWDEHTSSNPKSKIYYNRSTDTGASWGAITQMTYDTASSIQSFVAVSGTVVHVIWADKRNRNMEIYYKRDPTGNVGIQNISTEIPSAYSLSQNYPNPFNPISNIKYKISKSSNVRITVFDVTGKEVEVLVDEKQSPGEYLVTFDGSNLSSGIYFYKITAGDFTETRRLTLLK